MARVRPFGFFQIRYGSNLGTPRPRGKVAFTIGSRWGDVTKYMYSSWTNAHGHAVLDWEAALSEVVVLTEQELRRLFGNNPTITKDQLQRADIYKIHGQMFLTSPPLHYGVLLGFDDVVLLNEDGRAIPDGTLEDYQNGRTIVYPVAYASRQPTRLFFNLGTPAVREYAVQYALHRQGNGADSALFADNVMTNQKLYVGADGESLHHVSTGTAEEQMLIRARQIIDILKEVKSRPDPKGRLNGGTILNCVRDGTRSATVFLGQITKPENRGSFDMMMAENRFYDDGRCTNIEFYLKWSKALSAAGKSLIFVVSGDQFQKHSPIVTKIWLWLHLVCGGNNYVYLNDSYSRRMIKYPAYRLNLGRPLEEPRKVVDTWYRRFRCGTIVFDTSSSNIGAIRFERASVLTRAFQWM